MNKVFCVGNLVKDPEYRKTQGDISVCTFTVACNRRRKEDGADFLNIVTWRGIADNCGKYLKKGRRVAVVGSIQNRSYDDKNGAKHYVTEIIADEVEFLSSGKQEEMTQVNDADLPF